jgi:acyl carrier protein
LTLTQAALSPVTPGTVPESLDRTLAVMRTVLQRRFGIDDPGLSPDRELASLGLDSLAFIEYAFELEQDLDIHLPDLPRDMVTVGDHARFVAGEVDRQAKGAGAQ